MLALGTVLSWKGPTGTVAHTPFQLPVLQTGQVVIIVGDFNYALEAKMHVEDEGFPDFLAGMEQRGITFTVHNAGQPSAWEVADRRYQQAAQQAQQAEAKHKQQTRTRPVAAVEAAYREREAALQIRDKITPPDRRRQGGEIDFVCSMVSAVGPGGVPPQLSLTCSSVATSYVKLPAGFDHGPLTARFIISPSGKRQSICSASQPLTCLHSYCMLRLQAELVGH